MKHCPKDEKLKYKHIFTRKLAKYIFISSKNSVLYGFVNITWLVTRRWINGEAMLEISASQKSSPTTFLTTISATMILYSLRENYTDNNNDNDNDNDDDNNNNNDDDNEDLAGHLFNNNIGDVEEHVNNV